jgi:hypothetical protein
VVAVGKKVLTLKFLTSDQTLDLVTSHHTLDLLISGSQGC